MYNGMGADGFRVPSEAQRPPAEGFLGESEGVLSLPDGQGSKPCLRGLWIWKDPGNPT